MIKIIKAIVVVCLAALTNGLGVPVGPVGHVAYGAPWGGWSPYGGYPDQPAFASQSQNVIRAPFNLGHISTDSKAIDTPFSSVRKADIRVSNPGLIAPLGVSQYASHVGHFGVAPVAKVATGGVLGVAYSPAPAVSHMTFTNGLGVAYSW